MLMQETMDTGMNRAIGGIDFEIFGKFNKDFSDWMKDILKRRTNGRYSHDDQRALLRHENSIEDFRKKYSVFDESLWYYSQEIQSHPMVKPSVSDEVVQYIVLINIEYPRRW